MKGTTMGLRISSRCLDTFKLPSIKYNCVRCPWLMPAHTITPPPPWDCHTLICFTCPCDCLHPPSRCHRSSLLPSVYLYRCSLFVCRQFVLSCQVNQRFSKLLFFLVSLFESSRFWPFAYHDTEPACLTILPAPDLEPACTVWTLTWLWTLACPRLPLACTSLFNKYQRLEPSASCVCIWVSPCVVITQVCPLCQMK